MMYSMKQTLIFSFLARMGLLVYGMWQDANMAVKFTDVDYHVFSDAADFVSQMKSPYLRSTYRYTPLLAWLLSLNAWFSPLFGKVVFIIFDVLIGHTVYCLLLQLGHSKRVATNCSLMWLCNPLAATVSSRGNAESIMAFLVLTSLKCLMNGKTVWSAVFYALSIHVKIYPVTYALPIYLYLGDTEMDKDKTNGVISRRRIRPELNSFGTTAKSIVLRLFPNRERIIFGAASALVLGGLTLSFYLMYGWIFIYETYLYHIVRGDIRHNFSPYFYLLYLATDIQHGVPLYLRLLVFLPQLCMLLAVAVCCHKDQPLCWFLCTYVFVMANKVCTSQYFLWYLSLLPVIAPQLRLSIKSAMATLALWFLGQGLWLFPAYYLEFEGHNTFLLIWLAGLAFYVINAYVVYVIITSYSYTLQNRKHAT